MAGWWTVADDRRTHVPRVLPRYRRLSAEVRQRVN